VVSVFALSTDPSMSSGLTAVHVNSCRQNERVDVDLRTGDGRHGRWRVSRSVTASPSRRSVSCVVRALTG
jgi:hypothetical protein